MRLCALCTREYEADLRELIKARLDRLGCGDMLYGEGGDNCALARISGEAELDIWCRAASGVLKNDLAQLEMARMVNALDFTVRDKQQVLANAISNVRVSASGLERVAEELKLHYGKNELLMAEGFVRFRMPDVVAGWESAVMAAAQEHMLKKEYAEMMGVLAAFYRLAPSRVRELSLILNPDGSCTLTDDSDARIDYENCTSEGVISMLVGLAPERITVYDLSGGTGDALLELVSRVFCGRVRLFRRQGF